ncbi:MAG TPA: DUF4129 domain-containing protein [Dehalococcoidia bacterium]
MSDISIRDARSALILLIEVIWGFAAAAVFVRIFSTHRSGPSLLAVAAVVVAASALGYLLQREEGDGDASGIPLVAAAISVVAIFIIAQFEYAPSPWAFGWLRDLPSHGEVITDSERGVIAGVVVLTLLWVRSTGTAARIDNASAAFASVLFGLAAVALAAVVSPPARGPDIFGALALAYVPLALVVLAMYQVTEPDRPLRESLAQSGPWLAALIAATLVVAVIASAIDPRSLGALAPIGRPLLFTAALIAKFLLAPIFFVLAAIINHFPSLPNHTIPAQPAMPPPPGITKQHGTPEWQTIVGRVLAGVVIAVLVAIALALIWLALRRLRPKKRTGHEVRESIEDEEGLGSELGDLLGGLLNRFRRPRRASSTGVAVRRLYHEMLAEAAAAGVERKPSATPLQFAPRLDAHYGSPAPTAISRAFTQSRYGHAQVDQATVDELRRQLLTRGVSGVP